MIRRISRRSFNKLGAGTAVSSLLNRGFTQGRSDLNERPNVIFFMTDDQRMDSMGCAGNSYLLTPNMDRIAEEGARFTNAFVTNSLCGPSRATCLTGMYSHNTGVRVNEGTFPAGQVTIFERARNDGYRTAFVGKWHNKRWGRDRDFDYYFGFRGQGQYHDPLIRENQGPEKRYNGWVEDVLADKTIDFIKSAARGDAPFLVCHWFKTPHQECLPAERHKNLFSDISFPKPATFNTDYKGKPKAVKEADLKIGGTGPTSYVSDWDEFMRNYHRVLVGVDENVGRILNTLDNLEIAGKTLVIFTSDNGYFLGEHGFFDKRLMYEPSIRIPLLIRYPNQIAAGQTIEELTLNIDFAPTILDYVGLPIPKEADGKSLRPLLQHQPILWRKDFLYEYYAYPDWHNVKPHKGVRTKRWKYIEYYDFPRHEFELYDLENDPGETVNLVDDARYEKTVSQLKRRLIELRVEAGDPDLKYE